MSEDKKQEPKRPMDPKTGAIVLLGSLMVTAVAVWALSTFMPIDTSGLARANLAMTSFGAWMILGTWILFPAVFATAFLILAKGVDPFRLAFAFAGVTYFLQCYAELTARDEVAMWPELLFTAIPTIIFYSLAKRRAPANESDTTS